MSFTLEQGSAIAQILDVAVRYILPLILAGYVGGIAGERKARKKLQSKLDNRLFNNLQRPMVLLPSKADPLALEERLLRKVDFFKVDLMPADKRSIDEVTANHRLVVARYENTEDFWHVFQKIADKQVPLIIYATPGEIKMPELEKIQSTYTRYTICNTPVRLVSDVFAIMSVYPDLEGKKS